MRIQTARNQLTFASTTRDCRRTGLVAQALLPVLLLIAATTAKTSSPQAIAQKPKIRAVTAFIRLDRSRYESQIQETLKFLRAAKSALEKSGYEVEGIRITTQPFPEYTQGMSAADALAFFRAYDALAVKRRVRRLHRPCYDQRLRRPAQRGPARPNYRQFQNPRRQRQSSPEKMESTGNQFTPPRASSNTSQHTRRTARGISISPPPRWFRPTLPFTQHPSPAKKSISRSRLQSANVVADVFSSVHSPDEAVSSLRDTLGRYAQEIEATAKQIDAQTGWKYGGIDLSPAPLKEVSIGGAIEKFYGAPLGSSGTLTVAAIITRALKEIPVTHAGYSGLMLPVLEDSVIAQRWSEGRLTMDSLLSYSAVCGTGPRHDPAPRRYLRRPTRPHPRRCRQPLRQMAQAAFRAPATHRRKKSRRHDRARRSIPRERQNPTAAMTTPRSTIIAAFGYKIAATGRALAPS